MIHWKGNNNGWSLIQQQQTGYVDTAIHCDCRRIIPLYCMPKLALMNLVTKSPRWVIVYNEGILCRMNASLNKILSGQPASSDPDSNQYHENKR